MLNYDFTEKLLRLEDVILKNIEKFEDTLVVHIQMPQRIHTCPQCGTQTSKVHDYRTQLIKHTPACGQHVLLSLRKRRHVCPSCKKRFFESVPFLSKYQRTSHAFWAMTFTELSQSCSLKSVAQRMNVSIPTVSRILNYAHYELTHLPEVLSIDEFRGNSGGEKFQCILTNPKTKRVLDILPSKKTEELYGYFSAFAERKQVKYVVMDLSPLFRSVAKNCFPNAQIIADRFHTVRLATNALEQVRKEVQKEFHESRRKYFKRSRTLLLKHKDKLKEKELEQVANMLMLSKDLAKAYYLKELVYELFASEDLYTAKKRMLYFKMAAQTANLESFNRVSETYTEWEKEILNAFKVPYSNGYTEGCNNKIKVIKRISYGMPNFKHFRTRILHIMTN